MFPRYSVLFTLLPRHLDNQYYYYSDNNYYNKSGASVGGSTNMLYHCRNYFSTIVLMLFVIVVICVIAIVNAHFFTSPALSILGYNLGGVKNYTKEGGGHFQISYDSTK